MMWVVVVIVMAVEFDVGRRGKIVCRRRVGRGELGWDFVVVVGCWRDWEVGAAVGVEDDTEIEVVVELEVATEVENGEGVVGKDKDFPVGAADFVALVV